MQSATCLKATITRSSNIETTARVLQLQGLFDVPAAEKSSLSWDVSLPLHEKPWNVGLIVGPSGCGKSTIAKELFGDHLVNSFTWNEKQSLLDSFPENLSIKDITLLLSSVGFSSPPSWVRPFHVLSNGEQFRATIARALCEQTELCVIDEFTSVVDRTVAQIGSAAIAKTVRQRGGQFIAVTCHYDVQDWLDPDWVYDPSTNEFSWRLLRGRPPIRLDIYRVHHSLWRIFAPHHYLTAELNPAATCFAAFYNGRPVAFDAWLPFVGRLKHGKAKRVSRMVCLPDFQGVGIGNALVDYDASMWRALGFRVFLSTAHPSAIASRYRSKSWTMTRAPSRTGTDNKHSALGRRMRSSRASSRLTASFEYVGKTMDKTTATNQLNAWHPSR